MNAIPTQTALPFFVLFIAIVFAFFLGQIFYSKIKNLIQKSEGKIQELIKYAVAPKSIELSLGVNDLVDLAIEIWRMDQRIMESASSLPENHSKGLNNSIERLKRYIEKYDIEIVDYTNQKFNDGWNLEVLSVEKDPSIPYPIVKKTIEPTIICKGQVARRAKIILLTNN